MKIFVSSLKLLYVCTCFMAIHVLKDASSFVICKLIFFKILFLGAYKKK